MRSGDVRSDTVERNNRAQWRAMRESIGGSRRVCGLPGQRGAAARAGRAHGVGPFAHAQDGKPGAASALALGNVPRASFAPVGGHVLSVLTLILYRCASGAISEDIARFKFSQTKYPNMTSNLNVEFRLESMNFLF